MTLTSKSISIHFRFTPQDMYHLEYLAALYGTNRTGVLRFLLAAQYSIEKQKEEKK